MSLSSEIYWWRDSARPLETTVRHSNCTVTEVLVAGQANTNALKLDGTNLLGTKKLNCSRDENNFKTCTTARFDRWSGRSTRQYLEEHTQVFNDQAQVLRDIHDWARTQWIKLGEATGIEQIWHHRLTDLYAQIRKHPAPLTGGCG